MALASIATTIRSGEGRSAAHPAIPRACVPPSPTHIPIDEAHIVRPHLARMHHRPPGEVWAKSWAAARGSYLEQVRCGLLGSRLTQEQLRRLASGERLNEAELRALAQFELAEKHVRRLIGDPAKLSAKRTAWLELGYRSAVGGGNGVRRWKRLLACDCPNSKAPRSLRRYCDHPACPSCHYRNVLRLLRQVWAWIRFEDALDSQSPRPKRSRRPRAVPPPPRLAVALVNVHVGPDEDLSKQVRALIADRAVAHIQRAGGMPHGISCTTLCCRGKQGWNLRIAVLGLTRCDVRNTQPQLARRRDGTFRPPVVWRASRSKRVSPRSLGYHLALALPYVRDFSGVSIKRVQGLGRCREFVRARHTPGPISFRGITPRWGRQQRRCPAVESQGRKPGRRRVRTAIDRARAAQRAWSGRLFTRVGLEFGLTFEEIRRAQQWVMNSLGARDGAPSGEDSLIRDLCVLTHDVLGLNTVVLPYELILPDAAERRRFAHLAPPPEMGPTRLHDPAWVELRQLLIAAAARRPADYAGLKVALWVRPPGRGEQSMIVHRILDAARYHDGVAYHRGADVVVQRTEEFLEWLSTLAWAESDVPCPYEGFCRLLNRGKASDDPDYFDVRSQIRREQAEDLDQRSEALLAKLQKYRQDRWASNHRSARSEAERLCDEIDEFARRNPGLEALPRLEACRRGLVQAYNAWGKDLEAQRSELLQVQQTGPRHERLTSLGQWLDAVALFDAAVPRGARLPAPPESPIALDYGQAPSAESTRIALEALDRVARSGGEQGKAG